MNAMHAGLALFEYEVKFYHPDDGAHDASKDCETVYIVAPDREWATEVIDSIYNGPYSPQFVAEHVLSAGLLVNQHGIDVWATATR